MSLVPSAHDPDLEDLTEWPMVVYDGDEPVKFFNCSPVDIVTELGTHQVRANRSYFDSIHFHSSLLGHDYEPTRWQKDWLKRLWGV